MSTWVVKRGLQSHRRPIQSKVSGVDEVCVLAISESAFTKQCERRVFIVVKYQLLWRSDFLRDYIGRKSAIGIEIRAKPHILSYLCSR